MTGFGEKWEYPASWVQLAGLLVLFVGTAMYNGSLGEYDQGYASLLDSTGEADSSSLGKTPAAMASPSLVRSPMIYAQQRKAELEKLKQMELAVKNKGRYTGGATDA